MRVSTGAQLLLQHGRALDISARDPGSAITLSLPPRSNHSWAALLKDLPLSEEPIEMQQVGFAVRVHCLAG